MNLREASSRLLRPALWLLVAVCCWQACSALVGRMRFGSQPEFVPGYRSSARCVSEDRVGVLCEDRDNLDSIDRSRLIAANWELAPRVAEAVDLRQTNAWPTVVLVSSYLSPAVRGQLTDLGYSPVASNEFSAVWTVGPAVRPFAEEDVRVSLREALSVLAVLSLMCLVAWWCAGTGCLSRDRTVLACVVFGVLGAAAMSHGLLTPNGLGVQAGKAKLLLLAGGVPEGFWSDPRYAVYQPSYPPGLTLLSAAFFLLAGTFGDWLVQLLEPAAMALVFWVLSARTEDRLQLVCLASFLLCPTAQRLASGFYAEPFVLLCVAAGMSRVCAKGGRVGWLVVGCAGLFRHEGLLLAVGLWCGLRLTDGKISLSDVADLVLAMLPGLAWQVFVWSRGAGLFDYDFGALPRLSQMREAWHVLLKTYGQYGLAAGAVFLLRGRKLVFAGWATLLLAAGPFLLGFSTSTRFEWVASTVLPRYGWLWSGVCLSALCYNTRHLCWNSSKRR